MIRLLNNTAKYVQRRFYTFLNYKVGFFFFIVVNYILIWCIFERVYPIQPSADQHFNSNNIASINAEKFVSYGPIDAVYTWVNGSDPLWQKKKEVWKKFYVMKRRTVLDANITNEPYNKSINDETMSNNRYRDSNELLYSLRALVKNAPWIRHIYLVTDNQIPSWLNLKTNRLTVISHEEIFINKSQLPVFSSPAIESQLHRIPGLSKKFIYFNDDVFLGAPTLPEDFFSISGIHKFYLSWDVPKCAPGCADSWIGDGFCDKACNVSSCNFDYPDCVNGSNSQYGGNSMNQNYKPQVLCTTGCPPNWLADRICDMRCKVSECAWDIGDCGIDLIEDNHEYPHVILDDVNTIFSIHNTTDETDKIQNSSIQLHNVTLESIEASNGTMDDELKVINHTQVVSLSVVYKQTKVVYFDLSYIPCYVEQIVSIDNPSNSKSQKFHSNALDCTQSLINNRSYHSNNLLFPNGTFEFIDAKHSESDDAASDDGKIIHQATLLSNHNLLVVLLLHDQDNAPHPPVFPYTVEFTITARYTYPPGREMPDETNAMSQQKFIDVSATFRLSVVNEMIAESDVVNTNDSINNPSQEFFSRINYSKESWAPDKAPWWFHAMNAQSHNYNPSDVNQKKIDLISGYSSAVKIPGSHLKDAYRPELKNSFEVVESFTLKQPFISTFERYQPILNCSRKFRVFNQTNSIKLKPYFNKPLSDVDGALLLLGIRPNFHLNDSISNYLVKYSMMDRFGNIYIGYLPLTHALIQYYSVNQFANTFHYLCLELISSLQWNNTQSFTNLEKNGNHSIGVDKSCNKSRYFRLKEMCRSSRTIGDVFNELNAGHQIHSLKELVNGGNTGDRKPEASKFISNSRFRYKKNIISLHTPDDNSTDDSRNASYVAIDSKLSYILLLVPQPTKWKDSQSEWIHEKVQILRIDHNDLNNTTVDMSNDTQNYNSNWNRLPQHIVWKRVSTNKSHNLEANQSTYSEDVMSASNESQVGFHDCQHYFECIKYKSIETLLNHSLQSPIATIINSIQWGSINPLFELEEPIEDDDYTETGGGATLHSEDSEHIPQDRRLSDKVQHDIDTNSLILHNPFTQISSPHVDIQEFQKRNVHIFSAYEHQHSNQTMGRRRLDGEDTFAGSLIHVNRMYHQTFGHESRKVPAHVPHVIDKDYMNEMQSKWSKEWNTTAGNRFRSANDMQYSFSFYYYVMNRNKLISPDRIMFLNEKVDTNLDGFISKNEFRTLASIVKGKEPTQHDLKELWECVTNASKMLNNVTLVHKRKMDFQTKLGRVRKSYEWERYPLLYDVMNCSLVVDGLNTNVDWNKYQPTHVAGSDKEIVAFEMIGDNITETMIKLDSVRARQSKFVCINDNMQNPSKELIDALKEFYESFVPSPSIFELPHGQRNPTLYLDEYKKLQIDQQISIAGWIGILSYPYGYVKRIMSHHLLNFLHYLLKTIFFPSPPGHHDDDVEELLHRLERDLNRNPTDYLTNNKPSRHHQGRRQLIEDKQSPVLEIGSKLGSTIISEHYLDDATSEMNNDGESFIVTNNSIRDPTKSDDTLSTIRKRQAANIHRSGERLANDSGLSGFELLFAVLLVLCIVGLRILWRLCHASDSNGKLKRLHKRSNSNNEQLTYRAIIYDAMCNSSPLNEESSGELTPKFAEGSSGINSGHTLSTTSKRGERRNSRTYNDGYTSENVGIDVDQFFSNPPYLTRKYYSGVSLDKWDDPSTRNSNSNDINDELFKHTVDPDVLLYYSSDSSDEWGLKSAVDKLSRSNDEELLPPIAGHSSEPRVLSVALQNLRSISNDNDASPLIQSKLPRSFSRSDSSSCGLNLIADKADNPHNSHFSKSNYKKPPSPTPRLISNISEKLTISIKDSNTTSELSQSSSRKSSGVFNMLESGKDNPAINQVAELNFRDTSLSDEVVTDRSTPLHLPPLPLPSPSNRKSTNRVRYDK